MSIYKYGGVWMYQEDYQSIVNISHKEDYANSVEQNQIPQLDEAPNMPQEPSFDLAHLDAMEQHLNECIDNRMQGMEDRLIFDALQASVTTKISNEQSDGDLIFKLKAYPNTS
ncbi:hypothetical protein Lal_00016864 [Lupinus albus]|nr:hypothetical protein Lal_00016864 [Lupinus albus]